MKGVYLQKICKKSLDSCQSTQGNRIQLREKVSPIIFLAVPGKLKIEMADSQTEIFDISF